jgi:hypothetical protein
MLDDLRPMMVHLSAIIERPYVVLLKRVLEL